MRLIPLATLLLLGGCATLTAESTQAIHVDTAPEGARCILTNGAGRWVIEQTPGSVDVDRHFSPLAIQCINVEGMTASTTLEPQTRSRAWGNILLGGAPAIVDANTGAGYEYEEDSAELSLAPQP